MTQYPLGRVLDHQPVFPRLSRSWVSSAALTVVLASAYFLAARLGLVLLTKPDGVAVFWPAAGVATGALISLGLRMWLPVVIGTMVATVVANLLGDRNLWSAVVFALSNAGEAVLVAALIEKYFGSPFNLDRLPNVVGLIGATIVGTAISGIGGTFGFELFHTSPAPVFTVWQHWFSSDALGIIIVAPLLIGLASVVREPPPHSEVIEAASI